MIPTLQLGQLGRRVLSASGGGLSSGDDDFSTNTISSYTAIQQGGTPNWAIASGKLSCSVGTHALLLRTGVTATNTAIECDSNTMHDGGLVLRVQDANNYYLCGLYDDSGASGSNFQIFRCVAGTFSFITSANVTWPRGTSATLRFSANGNTLKAYFNGSQVLSTLDSTFSGAGGVGMRSNGTGSQTFDRFQWGLTP